MGRLPAFALALWVALSAGAGAQIAPPARSDAGGAANAYGDLIARFWRGPAATGHLAVVNGNIIANGATGDAGETGPFKGWLWQYAQGWNVLYARWKVTGGDADARTRLVAEWAWVQSHWALSDLAICGAVGGQSATTEDDAAWLTRGLIEFYDVTGDPNALAYAKAMFDCMNTAANGFYDIALGGGGSSTWWYDETPISSIVWSGGSVTVTTTRIMTNPPSAGQLFNVSGAAPSGYDGTFTAVTVSPTTVTYALASNPGTATVPGFYHSGIGQVANNVNLALSEALYYQTQCPIEGGSCPLATAYYTNARATADWANAVLDRSQNTNCAIGGDHLYWGGVNGGSPPLPSNPNGSTCGIPNNRGVMFIFSNMAGAALNALIYNVTCATTCVGSYQTQARNMAASLIADSLDTCGGWLDDRDPRGGGFAAWDFGNLVMPLIANPQPLIAATLATARNVAANDRQPDGAYGGDWCGPVATGYWTTAGFNPDQIEISANAAIWPIAALPWAAR